MCSYEERSSVENIEKTCPFIVNLTFFMRRHTGRTGGNHAERIKDLIIISISRRYRPGPLKLVIISVGEDL